jgi:predicted NBD/HSP70 family sugar kinase
MAKAQSPPVARQLSVRAIMEAILHKGPTSRAMLAKLTGLSRQTTTQVVLELERDGWLQVSGRMQGPVGRSAPTYELNPRAAYVLGIRLEGSIVQMALADIRGDVVSELSEPTNPNGGLEVVNQLGRLFLALLTSADVERERVRFGVMGSPGVVDPRSGHIDIAPSIPHLNDINFVEAVRRALDLELTIENGVKLAALGELWQGEARGTSDFAYFGIGSGVGMGLVSEGRLLRGARGAAGEIAYLPIGGDPFDPAGSANGTFESAVNSNAIVRRYEGYGGEPGLGAAAIMDRLEAGDPQAIAALDETARLVALAISAVSAVIDPELIVLGGSVGARPAFAQSVASVLPRLIARPLPIRSSALGNRAALVGALGQALDRLHADLFGVEAVGGETSLTASSSAADFALAQR